MLKLAVLCIIILRNSKHNYWFFCDKIRYIVARFHTGHKKIISSRCIISLGFLPADLHSRFSLDSSSILVILPTDLPSWLFSILLFYLGYSPYWSSSLVFSLRFFHLGFLFTVLPSLLYSLLFFQLGFLSTVFQSWFPPYWSSISQLQPHITSSRIIYRQSADFHVCKQQTGNSIWPIIETTSHISSDSKARFSTKHTI